jgi:hypothetical protein
MDVLNFYVLLIGVVMRFRQRVCIKLCASLGESEMKSLAMIRQALGEKA